MERKRRKSENAEDKRARMTPSIFRTPVSGHKEQKASRFVEWDANEVASFLYRNKFGDYASIFQGISLKATTDVFGCVHKIARALVVS